MPLRFAPAAIFTSRRKMTTVALVGVLFFASRRRHTRCSRDWSSDVCSSDLYPQFATHNAHTLAAILELAGTRPDWEFQRLHGMGEALYAEVVGPDKLGWPCRVYEIGRASCRERV